MRIPRLSLMERLLVVAILGLICLLPVQFWRAIVAYDMQMAAEYHDGIAAELAVMDDHPAAWMDEFRDELRRISAREKEQAERIARGEVGLMWAWDRAPAGNMAALNRDQFWMRFNQSAKRAGYERPHVRTRVRPSITPVEAIFECWHIICAVCLLIWLLIHLRSIRQTGNLPDTQPGR
jgi:hypothetical protein